MAEPALGFQTTTVQPAAPAKPALMTAPQAATPTQVNTSTFGPGSKAPPSYGAGGIAQQTQQPRQIADRDLIDSAGLGPMAEVLTVTMLCIVCTFAVAGFLTYVTAKFFGDADYWKSKSNEAEKMWFDLQIRLDTATANATGRKRIYDKLEG
jgi:hypothetical protein